MVVFRDAACMIVVHLLEDGHGAAAVFMLPGLPDDVVGKIIGVSDHFAFRVPKIQMMIAFGLEGAAEGIVEQFIDQPVVGAQQPGLRSSHLAVVNVRGVAEAVFVVKGAGEFFFKGRRFVAVAGGIVDQARSGGAAIFIVAGVHPTALGGEVAVLHESHQVPLIVEVLHEPLSGNFLGQDIVGGIVGVPVEQLRGAGIRPRGCHQRQAVFIVILVISFSTLAAVIISPFGQDISALFVNISDRFVAVGVFNDGRRQFPGPVGAASGDANLVGIVCVGGHGGVPLRRGDFPDPVQRGRMVFRKGKKGVVRAWNRSHKSSRAIGAFKRFVRLALAALIVVFNGLNDIVPAFRIVLLHGLYGPAQPIEVLPGGAGGQRAEAGRIGFKDRFRLLIVLVVDRISDITVFVVGNYLAVAGAGLGQPEH